MNLIKQLNEAFRTTVNDENVSMTLKQHADIKRVLKAKVAELKKAKIAATEALGEAERKLAAHEKIHPKYAERETKLQSKMEPMYEPGRSADRTPSGGMGGR